MATLPVVDARTLPLFPLPVVLFPGAALPLHIFEPRYRRMLADCMAGDRRFGLIYCPPGTAENALPPGQVGCIAGVDSASELPDGRSNILVSGIERFAFVRLVPSPAPYHVAEIEPYDDVDESRDVQQEMATRVRETFDRMVEAYTVIADQPAPVPALPDDPALLPFSVAPLVDMDVDARQRLLASRSPSHRLRELHQLLMRAVGPLEQHAQTHRRAAGNGGGPIPQEPGQEPSA
ncbi:MAG TPA: LON peptidase substrate-binding domain-containing protein [Gemmatimonadaceae bacterium]|nr:LON peptidase substrate-binding domain-containing protein [Gemmatimonadaceae bacterium]